MRTAAVMPSTAAARRVYEDQLPSFMSVFDLDGETMADRETVTLVDTNRLMGGSKSLATNGASHDPPQQQQHPQQHSQQPPHLQKQPQQLQQQLQHQHQPQHPQAPSSDHAHKHTDSTSTRASESTDSSPTTTLSTTDSSPLSDPSDPSPSSPICPSALPTLIPLNSYPSTSFGRLGSGIEPLSIGSGGAVDVDTDTPIQPHLERPMTSPAAPRRPRNMKGLFIQPPSVASNTIALGSDLASPAPTKPPFCLGAAGPVRRKPSLLSLKTNACDLVARGCSENGNNGNQDPVPSSPGGAPPLILQRRALKHSTSSPQMLSGLKSCMFGPTGGMSFPKVLERNESGLSAVLRPLKSGSAKPASSDATAAPATIHEEDSPIKPQLASRAQLDREPFAAQENNEDQRSPGYPDGPVAIYGSSVFLYMEPTAEEASRFDLVINVAREVKNPFHPEREDFANEEKERGAGEQGQERGGRGVKRQESGGEERPGQWQWRWRQRPDTIHELPSPIPDTAATDATFATAFEHQPDEWDEGPRTATAEKRQDQRNQDMGGEPEYVHIPWDHHTNIATDLMSLCEKIDSRVREGKKVLIHCQQGASRSASLVIAYGMYLDPDLTVNDAYYAAQARSRWISPNMKLMYCLQDFQKEVSRRRRVAGAAGVAGAGVVAALGSSHGRQSGGQQLGPGGGPSKNRVGNLSGPIDDAISASPREPPQTAPLLGADGGGSSGNGLRGDSPAAGESPTQGRQLGIMSATGRCISPGPSSAPSSMSWPESEPVPESVPESAPSRQQEDNPAAQPLIHTTRQHAFEYGGKPGAVHHQPSRTTAVFHPTAADPDALLSPRAETMTRNPFRETFEQQQQHQQHPLPGAFSALRLVEVPPTPTATAAPATMMTTTAELELPFSPRASISREPIFPFVRPAQAADPRSPATVGEAQIVRSIDEVCGGGDGR